jgi:arginyl-tRNA synthetase
VSEAVGRAFDVQISVEEALVRHAPAEHGDYQSNVALSLARRVGQPPRQVAERIVAELDLEPLLDPPRIAGPGFVNRSAASGSTPTALTFSPIPGWEWPSVHLRAGW